MGDIEVPAWAEQTVIIIVNIFISYAVGCATQLRNFRKIAFLTPIIPMCSQFILQPLYINTISKALKLPTYAIVGMLLSATTPGGNGSNIAEVLFGGDVELGIFATMVSTLIASAAIPVNFEIYCTPLLESVSPGAKAPVPWEAIGTAIAVLIVGTVAGCLTRYYHDQLGKRLENICVKIGVVLIAIALAFAAYSTKDVWALITWRTWVVGMLAPPGKFIVTYVLCRLARQTDKVAKTLAMEAGEQNIAVALAIISIAYRPSLERNLILSGLIVYALFNQAVATPLATILFYLHNRRLARLAAERDAAVPAEVVAGESARSSTRRSRASLEEAGGASAPASEGPQALALSAASLTPRPKPPSKRGRFFNIMPF